MMACVAAVAVVVVVVVVVVVPHSLLGWDKFGWRFVALI
jgi:hypothetical protein